METRIIHTKLQCASIKSRKHPDQRCPNPATVKGDGVWCSVHTQSRIPWNPNITPMTKSKPIDPKFVLIIQRFWCLYGRKKLRKLLGPVLFVPEGAHNDKDIFTYDTIFNIPLTYRFSVFDGAYHWLFDIRFLTQLLQHGSDMKNPFTQESFPMAMFSRLQQRTEQLRFMKKPIVYAEEELTPEQLWNQKVLDVFLKMNSLGYGTNVLWFEGLHVRGHEMLYTEMYRLWTILIPLTESDRERIVPGHKSGRVPLFSWHPPEIVGRGFDIRWWRKQNLKIMSAFVSRSEDKDNQTCGALYVLRALANVHPRCGEAFPWLVYEDDED
jgi:hypothetical protein